MTGEALALVAAVCFGATDFFAGLLARRVPGATVAFYGQLAGTGLICVLAPLIAAPEVGPAALGWGALSGIGTGLGAAFLFRAMSTGSFSVVVPLSDVAAVALPIAAGVALLGDRPGVLGWAGIAAALPALWLMTRAGGDAGTAAPPATGTRDALVSGAGFALQFIALAQADPAAGLWPLAANRVASVLAILPMVLPRPARLRVPPLIAAGSAGTGLLGMAALALFALAGREQLLSVAVVITGLYPAIPVLLGLTLLRERLNRAQVGGLLCATAAIVLVSLR